MCQNTFKYLDVEPLTAQTIDALYIFLQQETHLLIVTTVFLYRLSYTFKTLLYLLSKYPIGCNTKITNKQLEYQVIAALL